jgi:hypothetical protein
MSSIAFVANFYLTEVFLAIARELQGVNKVYWFVVSEFDKKKLFAAGVQDERIIYMPMSASLETSTYGHGDIALNELIFSDRVLRHKPNEAKTYLESLAVCVDNALSRLDITIIFGESTWSHERIISKIAKRYDLYYLTPHTVRFPSGRFGFFEGESQETLFNSGGMSRATHRLELPVWEKPNYVKINDQTLLKERSLSSKVVRLRNFITKKNIDSKSPTNGTDLWARLIYGVGEEINKLMYNFIRKSTTLGIAKRRYFLYALHKQPESSIDVLGRFYDDQLKNIEVLHRCLPSQCKLVVKEHSNAIGDRSFLFYKKVQQMADVVLIEENCDTQELIKSSLGVFTVSGTIAYEAAYLGVPSFTFVKMFFNILPKCNQITIEKLRSINTLEDLLLEKTVSSNLEAIRSILCNSHEGVFTDVVTMPNVLEASNKDNLVRGFQKIIDFCLADGKSNRI